jgi:hypothetical protein
MPFQELSRRKRKDVKVEDIEVCVCLFAFDLLYLNGEVSFFLFSFWQISSRLSKFPSPCYNSHWRNVANC